MTLWFTLIMVIIVALVLVFMLVVGGSMVVDNAEKQLIKSVQDNSDEVEYNNGVLDLGEFNFYDTGVYTLIYDTEGKLIGGAGYAPFEGEDKFVNAATRKVSMNGGEYLIYDLYVEDPGGDLWLRGIRSTQEESTVVRTIVILSLILFPILVLIAALGGWLIAGRSFAPVRKIMDTVDSITDGGDLNARIGLRPGKDEIRRLGVTFDALLSRLSESFDKERQFASDVSHELRTPTAIILAECEFARTNHMSGEDYVEGMEVIERQGRKMSALIDELLSLSRMESGGRFSPENADLSELVEVVCDEAQMAQDKSITLEKSIAKDVHAEIDVGLMSRLVQNLLGNAYKFTEEGGTISVSLEKTEGAIRLSVRDSGCGIEEDDLPKIWNRLWQKDSSRSENKGSGLGLSMVQKIAQLHGGKMSVESAPGKGSLFVLTLPCGAES